MYRIEIKGAAGSERYLNCNAQPSRTPYYWKRRESAQRVISGKKSCKRDKNDYICVYGSATNQADVSGVSVSTNTYTHFVSQKPEKIHSELAEAMRVVAENADGVQDKLNAACIEVKKQDRVTQDILHCLEMEKCDATKRAKLMSLLEKSRLTRRKAKDKSILLTALQQSLKQEGLSIMRNAVDEVTERHYVPREMPEIFKKEG